MSNYRAESSPTPVIMALLLLALIIIGAAVGEKMRRDASADRRWALCVQQCHGSAVLVTVAQNTNSGCLCVEGSHRE